MTRGQTLAVVLVGSAVVGIGGYYGYQKLKGTGSIATALSGGRTAPSAADLGGAQANAGGGTVSLQVSATQSAVGQPVTLVAQASGINSPVYQFWYQTPDGVWHSVGNYSAVAQYRLTPQAAGTYHVIVYARSASAPAHETAAERAQYEANSDTWQLVVA